MGQEFRSSLAEWIWLKVSHKVAVKTSVRAAASEGLTGVEVSGLKMGHSQDCQQKATVPCHMDLNLRLFEYSSPEEVSESKEEPAVPFMT